MAPMKRLLPLFLLTACLGAGPQVRAEPTPQRDLAQLRRGFASASPEREGAGLKRLKQRLAPLPKRLETLVEAQREEGAPRAAPLERGLASSLALAERDPQWRQFPQREQLLQLLEQARRAQGEAGRQHRSGNARQAQAAQEQARQLTERALALLRQSEQEGRPKNQQPDDSRSGQPDASEQGAQEPGNRQEQSTPSSTRNQPEPSADQAAQQMEAKQALKELLKLQQRAQQEKDARRERMGLFQSGPQPVERDW